MSYLKINGEETQYAVKLAPFKSQHGYDAVRFVGEEVPETDKGFTYYRDNGEVIADLSRYTHFYRPNEYTVEEDVIVPPKGSDAPLNPSQMDVMSQRISQLNTEVNEITPYTDSKKAYYGEVEKVFYGVPSGNLSVFFDDAYTVERVEDRVYVKFARLTETKDITIMVQ